MMVAEPGSGLSVGALAGAALRIGAMLAAIWVVLLVILQALPDVGISPDLVPWLGIAPLLPVILASVAAKPFYIQHGKTATIREAMMLFVLLAGPVVVMAWLVEAWICHGLLRTTGALSLSEVLQQPWASRTTFTGLFGFSFVTTALGATLFGCLFQFPTKLRALDRMVRGTI